MSEQYQPFCGSAAFLLLSLARRRFENTLYQRSMNNDYAHCQHQNAALPSRVSSMALVQSWHCRRPLQMLLLIVQNRWGCSLAAHRYLTPGRLGAAQDSVRSGMKNRFTL
jgi:hypothetical protein